MFLEVKALLRLVSWLAGFSLYTLFIQDLLYLTANRQQYTPLSEEITSEHMTTVRCHLFLATG